MRYPRPGCRRVDWGDFEIQSRQTCKSPPSLLPIIFAFDDVVDGSNLIYGKPKQWQEKRIFYMTPQTLVNDLTTGICDPLDVILIVVGSSFLFLILERQ